MLKRSNFSYRVLSQLCVTQSLYSLYDCCSGYADTPISSTIISNDACIQRLVLELQP